MQPASSESATPESAGPESATPEPAGPESVTSESGGPDPLDIVGAVMEAWSRHDVDGVLAHMHDEVVWHYQVGSRPVVGIATMRKLLERLAGHQLDSAWRIIRHASRAEPGGRVALFVEAVDDYRNPDGKHVVVPYAGVYELEGDRIIGWRDYVDMGLMQSAENGEAPPDWIRELTARPAVG